MFNFSENYYLRQYYLEHEQVPTQSMMRHKMSPNLATVIFETLNPKVKVLAGLEPSLKGGGNDWYVCPKGALEEKRAVMRPLYHGHLTKLNHTGIIDLEATIHKNHIKVLHKEKREMLLVSDAIGKLNVDKGSFQQWQACVKQQIEYNTAYINHAFNEFVALYQKSLNSIEKLYYDGTVPIIKKVQEDTLLQMNRRYETLLKAQAVLKTAQMTAKLNSKKSELKATFIEQVEICRSKLAKDYHDLKVEKHAAVEKLRKYFECQNLACQIYVSLKEKEECLNELEDSKHKHKKKIKQLKDDDIFLDFDVRLAEQKEKRRQEFNAIWQKKVCNIVKKFQMFVSYCLNSLPDYAEFFINMEKLMLLQVSEALENPNAESIIEREEEHESPISNPKPFYLFCDKSRKAKVKQDLCPTSSSTPSASQLPAIIINKRCLYAACDNFEQFTNKIKEFIHGNRGDDDEFKDELIYEHFVPVKCKTSQQLSEVKLGSSLLQVLQPEMPNRIDVPFVCTFCQKPHCICTTESTSQKIDQTCVTPSLTTPSAPAYINAGSAVTSKTRLEHQREPKVESYLTYTEPKRCECVKKRTVIQHLPSYMRKTSMYDDPELPNYETCSITTLKKLVRKARGLKTPPRIFEVPSTTRDLSIQCSDPELDLLCRCFSDSDTRLIFRKPLLVPNVTPRTEELIEDTSSTYLTTSPSSFLSARAESLRQLIVQSPELIEIFRNNKHCWFD